MLLRSFTAKTLPEAMDQVRSLLGDEAIILSTQDDGLKGVKVTAALEAEDGTGFEPEVLEGGLEVADRISTVLDHHRVPQGLADRLLNAASNLLSDDWMMAMAAALDHELGFLPLSEIGPERPIMLIGPSGAGKSVTSAKLCACARLAGARSLLITMDSDKAGGRAQAETFAEVLGARLVCANDPESVAVAVQQREADEMAVIDTIGSNPFDEFELRRLSETAEAAEATLALVLPAGGDPAEAADAALAYASTGARTMIPTRLDAARRFGGLLAAAHVSSMSFLAAGVSRHIGAGLVAVNPVSLARLLSTCEPFEPSSLLAAD
ncbi:GTPase [Pelagibius litoralis]|uniref:GTPase n=1 Tax=Pelagibius litoralis TaxID=374515 RepID=A0A967EY25_9PROT|nr:GTPase [Pelagibius litoralis]NIA69489.1 GTPase [Pelagibius litoralis]